MQSATLAVVSKGLIANMVRQKNRGLVKRFVHYE